MSKSADKKAVQVTTRERSGSDDESSSSDLAVDTVLKSPRTARFAEATTVHSPQDTTKPKSKPRAIMIAPPSNHYTAEPQIADVGFGFNKHESVEMPNTDYQPPLSAIPKSPLKSAMKTPGAPPRNLEAMLSPTFQEEQILEKTEAFTDRKQAQDIKIKTRVQLAKFFLRGVNFSCSLIVLSMLTSTFLIFESTKTIPSRNNLPPWAANQKTWPQALLLGISTVSLVASLIVFWAYWRGGHKKAKKAAVYYTAWSISFFIFSIIMWCVGAAVIQHARTSGNNKDMWGWSCVDNTRKQLFENDVSYDLLCRLQNWGLVCAIIEIVVEVLTIAVYAVVFYRFWSKRQLRRTMAARDRARSELYTAQLRSAPNTPGPNGPLSARDGGWRPPADYFQNLATVEEGEVRYVDPDSRPRAPPTAFRLQAPPIRVQGATPKVQQTGFPGADANSNNLTVASAARRGPPAALHLAAPAAQPTYVPADEDEATDLRSPLLSSTFPPPELQREHVEAAPGEQVYPDVPIPGAYEAPLSPGAEPPTAMRFGGMAR